MVPIGNRLRSRIASAFSAAPTADRSCGPRPGGGNFLTMKDLERTRKRCTAEVPTRRVDADGQPIMRTCGAALWQYIG